VTDTATDTAAAAVGASTRVELSPLVDCTHACSCSALGGPTATAARASAMHATLQQLPTKRVNAHNHTPVNTTILPPGSTKALTVSSLITTTSQSNFSTCFWKPPPCPSSTAAMMRSAIFWMSLESGWSAGSALPRYCGCCSTCGGVWQGGRKGEAG
jgi:hypothetical protein